MNKKYIIPKSDEISNIIKTGSKVINQYYIIYSITNKLDYNRYCISVSKKLGNAVVRNKLKRTIKEILRKSNIKNNKNYVIILRRGILELNYEEKKKKLFNILEENK